MKKLLTFFLTALLAFTVGWADQVTFDLSNAATTNGTVISELSNNGVTLTFNKATGSTNPAWYSGAVRLYANGTLTISSSQTITGIAFTASTASTTTNGGLANWSTTTGSYVITKTDQPCEASWTGSASSLTFTVASGKRVYLTKVVVTTSGGVTPAEPNWYRKVTSASDLAAGKKYIIVNEANGVGMGELNSNRFGTGVTGLTFDDNRVDIGGTNVMEMTLGGSSNNWTFQMPNGNYLSNSNSNNYTFFSATSAGSSSTDITKWTITPGASACAIQSNYVTAQYIRFISSTGLFGTYASTAQTAVALYVEDDGSTPAQACADPVFDPDGGVFTGSASVTITSATEDATIYYTTDGTDPVVSRSSIANGGTVELTESCTLKAMAVKSGMDNSNIVTSQSYTINPTGGGSGPFTLVTDASTLEAGDEIIFVSSGDVGSAEAMSTTQNNNNRGVAAVSVSSNLTVSATDETQIFTLQGGTGAWYFYTGSGYIYAASSTGNQLKTETTADNNAKATIMISSDGKATVVFQGNNTRNHLRYNGTNSPHIYSCYAETSTQAKPFIYRRSGAPSTDPRLEISPESQTISDAAPASLTITGENVNGNINASLANNNDWYLNPNTFGNTGGTTTLTYTGRALSATNTVTASASGATSVSATVNYVADLYIVTDNGSTGNWNFSSGTQMTNNNGVYTATFTAPNPNTFILFARKTGEGVNWNTRYVFGPDSNGDWWLDASGNGGGNIDLNDDDPIKIQGAGIYTVTIDANAGTFTITKQNINVTITPADGTHFTGSTISGTITSDPAGTIEWSTDGTNWQAYDGGFTLTVNQVGSSATVYARSTYNGVTSDVVSATYTRDLAPAPEAPSFSISSSAVAAGTVITITAPAGCTLYVNGEQVTSPYDVTINEATTITAYCENDEGTPSTTVTNSYTIAAVCNAIIEFKDNDSDATAATTWTAIGGTGDNDYFEAGKDYLDGASNISRVFKGMTGLKYGNSSNGGTITFSLDDQTEWKVSHITLNAKNYNGNNVTFTVSTDNGQSQTTSAIGSTLGGYTLDFDGSAITSITISASARAYLKGFTITYDCAPTIVNPVINPASGRYSEDQEVTITCSTPDATIYYTVNGGETQTYTEPFTVDVDEEHTQATIVAWAVKDDLTSEQVTATYTYYSYNGHVSSVAEFLELNDGEEAVFDNPVVVLFDYSQARNSNYETNGQEYIWIKDRTGYTQLFIQPAFDNTQGGFVPKYENGDVIPAGFKVKKNYFENGQYYQGVCYEWQSTFDDADQKALADPEQVTLSELLANPDGYNDRYLYINKLQVTGFQDDYGNGSGKWTFYIATDENGDNIAEVSGGSAIVGYNKYNSPAWKNKQGDVVGVTVPTDDAFYNVKFIFQKWTGGYEIMPIEFIPWQETTLRLEELVQVGVKDNEYTISNPLNAAKVTWDDNYEKFAIFAKDDEMYANKRYPNGLNEYSIDYQSQDGNIVNTVEQRDYDQSNWIEILIPSSVAHKTDQNYQTTLEQLQGRYENKILDGGTISGYYRNTLNPTIEMSAAPAAPTISSVYKPNIFCTANFLLENIDADGATSHRDNNQYFMMDGKPQEFAMVVWAYYPGNGDYFYAPMQVNDQVNGHNFNGIFKADMSLCEDILITHESAVMDCFDASNENGNSIDNVKMYGFNAIVRKNPAYWTPNANGAPRRVDVAPNTDGMETIPAYIVYPLNAGENANGTVTDVTEVNVEKKVVSVRYFNVMGMESEQPFDGINIIVTSYSDGSRSAIKVLK